MIPNAESVSFSLLLEQCPQGIERVRQLRNCPSVRKYMYNDHEIPADEHAAWLAGLRSDSARKVWVIRFHDRIEGVVALGNISPVQKTADWAFYLSPQMQGRGIGGIVEFKLLDIAFGEAGLEKLNCEVLGTNTSVIALHQKFGFRIEGVRRANVIKDGTRTDVVLLGIEVHEWHEKRGHFARLYASNR